MRLRPLVLFLALPFFFTCRGAEKAPPPIILISIDTLRADHLPMYGYRGVATPHLDGLRADGVLFKNAWSHSPLTLPSHATMLTGLLPAAHGVRDNTGFRLAPDVPTVPGILRNHGYAAGAAISAFVLRSATGMNAGFEAYDDRIEGSRGEKALGRIHRPGEETAAAAQKWIAANATHPFFYMLHLYEPHSPYEPPAPHATNVSSPYDGEIAHADAIVGNFLAFLKEQNIYDRAMIVLVSDHGEGLGDHGEEEHGIFLYREAISVPLVVKMPGGAMAGSSSSHAAGLFDLARTMLAAAGVEAPASMQGQALVAGGKLVPLPGREIYSETYYPRFHFGWSELHSLVAGNDHFIDAPRPELYDLARDPGEKQNQLEQNRRRSFALLEAIGRYKKEPTAPLAISPEEAQKLAALGYIGSGSAATSGPRADPKDKIATFRELQSAFRLVRQGKDAEALAALERLLKAEPDMVDVWDVRSKALFRLGRAGEAIESAKEALRRNPSAKQIAVDLANMLVLEGRLDEAKQHAELALTADPAKAHAVLARVALEQNELATAEREANAAVAAGGGDAALYTLASVQQKRGDAPAVLAATARITSQPPPRGLSSMRGDALARLGRDAEAEAAFRKELAAFPDNAEAARRLVVLLVAQDRSGEATQVIRGLATASPTPETYELIAETLKVIGDDDGARYWTARARQGQPR